MRRRIFPTRAVAIAIVCDIILVLFVIGVALAKEQTLNTIVCFNEEIARDLIDTEAEEGMEKADFKAAMLMGMDFCRVYEITLHNDPLRLYERLMPSGMMAGVIEVEQGDYIRYAIIGWRAGQDI